MPIQLDKILADIAGEKVVHPNFSPGASKKDVDDAWARVGKKNKLSVHETRSIFKVLQKKYEQEKEKESSAWKLFNIMDDLHRKDTKPDLKVEDDGDLPLEEEEEYDVFEVQEEEELSTSSHPHQNRGSTSDGESPTKSLRSNSSNAGSPDKDDKPISKTPPQNVKSFGPSPTTNNGNNTASTAVQIEEKKVLNIMASASPRQTPANQQIPSVTAAALHKKGIIMKKTIGPASSGGTLKSSGIVSSQIKNTARTGGQMLEVGKTIQLPESLKRKLSEDQPISQSKKLSIAQAATMVGQSTINKSSPTHNTGSQQILQVKSEREDQKAQSATSPQGINIITIPGNPTRVDLVNGLVCTGGGASSSTAATVASTSTNGFSPRIEDIDFRNDIIFEPGNDNGVSGNENNKLNTNATDIINLGNFDNSLPPTFFKNLCNSRRYEALGFYVANIMNRLRPRSAAKLELGILRAIIDVQSDDLEQ